MLTRREAAGRGRLLMAEPSHRAIKTRRRKRAIRRHAEATFSSAP
jgi:hypothetical protein